MRKTQLGEADPWSRFEWVDWWNLFEDEMQHVGRAIRIRNALRLLANK